MKNIENKVIIDYEPELDFDLEFCDFVEDILNFNEKDDQ